MTDMVAKFDVDEDLWNAAKVRAYTEKKTMKQWFTDLLVRELDWKAPMAPVEEKQAVNT